jgi:diguanylate cyclase (GGDEF)-like protein
MAGDTGKLFRAAMVVRRIAGRVSAKVARPAAGDADLEAVLDATRQLFWLETPAEAADVVRKLISALGGQTVPARVATRDALPVDVSFGEQEPLLPSAPALSVARLLLERHLPSFMLDAQRALELADKTVRLTQDASVDALTGLANRRMLNRLLGRLQLNDTLIMVDLDHFKAVNDTFGHSEGDRVLTVLGQTITGVLRARDHAGRYGGEEFLVILGADGASEPEPDSFLLRFRLAWEAVRPHPITFSAGVATVGPDPQGALAAADRALYRAKMSGRDQWQTATKEDYL